MSFVHGLKKDIIPVWCFFFKLCTKLTQIWTPQNVAHRKPSPAATPSWKLVPRPHSKHERWTAGSARETWKVPAADSVCCAHVGWEINFVSIETAPFFCVCPVFLGPPSCLLLAFRPISYMHSSYYMPFQFHCPQLGKEWKLRSSSLCSFLHPLVTLYLIIPNILFSILFSYIFNSCSFLIVRDQVSHPYRNTGKIVYSCVFGQMRR
jgi:hypothetical protein